MMALAPGSAQAPRRHGFPYESKVELGRDVIGVTGSRVRSKRGRVGDGVLESGA